jgi:hypothetical protein
MTNSEIKPEKITKPFQLYAVWMLGLIILAGILISGAKFIGTPTWISPVLCISAVAIIIIGIFLLFIMHTKFRSEFLDDQNYMKYKQWQTKEFKNFKPESFMVKQSEEKISITDNMVVKFSNDDITAKKDESWDKREERRINIYQHNKGLFLVHSWRPSHTQGQVADIAISLYQNRKGPLSEGKIESVEYHLGPLFFKEPVVKTNAKDNFRIDVSAYGPMLCLARVNFNDGTPPLDLERYIDFEY